MTGLKTTFVKIEQLSGSIAKRNASYEFCSPAGYFGNIPMKDVREDESILRTSPHKKVASIENADVDLFLNVSLKRGPLSNGNEIKF